MYPPDPPAVFCITAREMVGAVQSAAEENDDVFEADAANAVRDEPRVVGGIGERDDVPDPRLQWGDPLVDDDVAGVDRRLHASRHDGEAVVAEERRDEQAQEQTDHERAREPREQPTQAPAGRLATAATRA